MSQSLFHELAKNIGFQPRHPVLPVGTRETGLAFRMDWWNLFAVEGLLKSSPMKAPILQCSLLQLSHHSPYC